MLGPSLPSTHSGGALTLTLLEEVLRRPMLTFVAVFEKFVPIQP